MEGFSCLRKVILKDFAFDAGYFWHLWLALTFEYICEFSYKFEMAPKVYSGGPGKMIREKKCNKKSRARLPLTENQRGAYF
jgi:hypothetical protein